MKKSKFLEYNPKLKEKARELRNNSTLSEVLFWKEIKNKKLRYDFHRQKPIDNYIVDFFCPKLMLAIEIDGASHNDKVEYDKERQEKLESLGVRFIRFKDEDVKNNLEGCLDILKDWIEDNTPPG
ncbi:MAG TPA: endonuclease domain-containing protein [Candidatus Cloacimonetes bacterium]|nr:endonuclease domain-containing protein [Candidatus Cloacimonadota bacterium]